jgi:hypothetical protein
MSVSEHGIPSPTQILDASFNSSHGHLNPSILAKKIGVENTKAPKIFQHTHHFLVDLALATRNLVRICP